MSRPARGAWVEISTSKYAIALCTRRAPQGARGLKSQSFPVALQIARSRPARGAWVEIVVINNSLTSAGRAPQGARGLKYMSAPLIAKIAASRPARGAWVEICNSCAGRRSSFQSRPARGAWVEMHLILAPPHDTACRAPQGARGLKYQLAAARGLPAASRPARGAWVEIPPPSRRAGR